MMASKQIGRLPSPLVSLIRSSEAASSNKTGGLEYANSPPSLPVLLTSQSFDKLAVQSDAQAQTYLPYENASY